VARPSTGGFPTNLQHRSTTYSCTIEYDCRPASALATSHKGKSRVNALVVRLYNYSRLPAHCIAYRAYGQYSCTDMSTEYTQVPPGVIIES
jgi:3-methyladenine DNA glycosylase Mpg